ncbi:MAG: DUF4422 domain-containing protein [Lachnospiraceae bacterium]|nr:DUF4422 domain-containing protein [Lachnospiraceae bacterium]
MGSSEKDRRLKLYTVCSHVDKPLEQEPPVSAYECRIQAGAALTDKRICDLNDHDGFPESISDRNRRYSEATAMWWIGDHTDTPYVGITHYRRRFALTDEQIAGYMDDGIDAVVPVPDRMQWSVEKDYRTIFYSTDWDLFMWIIGSYAPADHELATQCFAGDELHSCNMGIFRSELYREYCEWAFPMLDAFYRQSPEKTDLYQRRDVGFIAERLTHLFIRKLAVQGKRIAQSEIVSLKSAASYTAESENCDRSDPDEIYRNCDSLYRQDQIGKCAYLLAEAGEQNAMDERLYALEEVLGVAQMESDHCPQTMHDYLPKEMRQDLATLITSYDSFRELIRRYLARGSEADRRELKGYIERTHFSRIAAACICGLDAVDQGSIDRLLRECY